VNSGEEVGESGRGCEGGKLPSCFFFWRKDRGGQGRRCPSGALAIEEKERARLYTQKKKKGLWKKKDFPVKEVHSGSTKESWQSLRQQRFCQKKPPVRKGETHRLIPT